MQVFGIRSSVPQFLLGEDIVFTRMRVRGC
nr:MAG TPA: hypothetical protein [Caudoviricetes sp.]